MVHHGPSHWISVRDAPKTSRTWSRLVPIEDMEKPWGNPGETMGNCNIISSTCFFRCFTCFRRGERKKWNIVQLQRACAATSCACLLEALCTQAFNQPVVTKASLRPKATKVEKTWYGNWWDVLAEPFLIHVYSCWSIILAISSS